MNLEQINTTSMEQAFQEADAEFSTPPFPKLEDLDLSHNQVRTEAGAYEGGG